VELAQLKAAVLKLLKEDEEFRYAVAGLIGLEEILKRLDRHEEELVKIWEELARLREDMNKGFQRNDQLFAEVFKRLDRHEEELVRLREDMNKRFTQHEERIGRVEEELAKLREDINRGFDRLQRRLDALGARWGMMSEAAFREGLRGVVEEELGLKVERWTAYDEEGRVFGYEAVVEVDVAVRDGKVILIEITSHARASDVILFKRKAELYAEKEGKRPDRLIIITPYAEEDAKRIAERLGIEIYTGAQAP